VKGGKQIRGRGGGNFEPQEFNSRGVLRGRGSGRKRGIWRGLGGRGRGERDFLSRCTFLLSNSRGLPRVKESAEDLYTP